MITCVFEEIYDHNTYMLKFGENHMPLMLEFVGIDKPSVGDKMMIHKDLLNVNSSSFTQPYAFNYLEGFSPMYVKKSEDKEYIILRIKNKNFALKRIYG